jgi:hypothetical protein
MVDDDPAKFKPLTFESNMPPPCLRVFRREARTLPSTVTVNYIHKINSKLEFFQNLAQRCAVLRSKTGCVRYQYEFVFNLHWLNMLYSPKRPFTGMSSPLTLKLYCILQLGSVLRRRGTFAVEGEGRRVARTVL